MQSFIFHKQLQVSVLIEAFGEGQWRRMPACAQEAYNLIVESDIEVLLHSCEGA